jgi:hypothetical protein
MTGSSSFKSFPPNNPPDTTGLLFLGYPMVFVSSTKLYSSSPPKIAFFFLASLHPPYDLNKSFDP